MKTCFYCNRQISNGTKILQDGIHHVCKDNIQLCVDTSTTQNKAQNKARLAYQKIVEQEDKLRLENEKSCEKKCEKGCEAAGERILEVGQLLGFTFFMLLPLEASRVVSVVVVACPLLIYMCGEYIATGDTITTGVIAEALEGYGKVELAQFAKDNHIIGMYPKLYDDRYMQHVK